MKKILLLVLIVIITVNTNAQITDIVYPKKQTIAYYDSFFVYKNFQTVGAYKKSIFIVEDSNKLRINDFELTITSKEKVLLGDELFYKMEYNLVDDKNNKYNFGLLFGNGLPYQAGLVAYGTDMRYGFSRTY